MALPPLRLLLDPRRSQDARTQPIAFSVNIPVDELPARTHELPARHAPVNVAEIDPHSTDAAEVLAGLGRVAVRTTDWKFGESEKGRLWSPNEFLLETARELEPKRALDLACGTGRDVVALAALGWEVVGVDLLPDALERANDLAGRYLPPQEARNVELRPLDLSSRPLPDLGRFDLITMFWFLDRQVIEWAKSLLNPGGSFVLETFTSVHREVHGKPRTESFVLQPGEAAQLASPLHARSIEEDWHDGRHSARLWASVP